jgi:hypothetical protein
MSNNKEARKVQEILGELSKSTLNKYKYVFVEGVDDVEIYQEIIRRKKLDLTKFVFEQTGGRGPLFVLNEAICLQSTIVEKTMMFADKDIFVFSSVPSEYENIHFTKGYSIENDLFEDGFDALMTELYPEEKTRFELLINNISEWYAYEMEKVFAGNGTDSKIAINGLGEIDAHSEQLAARFLLKRGYTQASEELTNSIKNNYMLQLRGKILFEVLRRIHLDRIRDSFRHTDVKAIRNIAFHQGIQNTSSNFNRIVRVFEHNLSNL